MIFALAKKVEQGSSLLAPGRSLSSSENTSPVQTEQAALPLVPLAESEEEEEEEEKEEGC